ncbi:WhiB family transcriptional regulator [Streptomyces sp. ET3-23]|uniref:WhiB family transcriptional regulator n=1 Tax=Streptomyces sp. ET3-23 TaxID=2885643 RepID=UPI001D1069A1|nr:WhiB family transcriptional regulator [Streptomyces sp. ET3-23]MCC2280833.1 WhiB family transcriptional regulator [Streptomyces sp. ET3-23]
MGDRPVLGRKSARSLYAIPARPGPAGYEGERLPGRRHLAGAVERLIPASAGAQPWDAYWRQRGACNLPDGDSYFFATRRQIYQQQALETCRMCVVSTECLAYALDERIPEGVFGGATAQWRQDLLERRPQVTSWRNLLERARTEHYRATSPRLPRPMPAVGRRPVLGQARARAGTHRASPPKP